VAILDNRTLIADAEVVDPTGNGIWEDETGSNMGVGTNTIHIEGSGSISKRISATLGAILFNYEASTDLSGSVIYAWINVSTPAALDTFAGGGIRMRFTGNTVTDWFDVFLEGSDTYNGGWLMLVVDVDDAKTASDAVNGTPPATTAIERVGIVFDVTGMAAGADDNCLVDAMWSLAAATPGIIVAGQNASNPWTFEDIVQAADVADDTKAWGTCSRLSNGTIALNTPVQFGQDDSTQDEFEDFNEVIGFDLNPVPDGFYGLSQVAGTGQSDVTMGIKTGSGDDATGAQGIVVTSGGPRWFMDFNDPDIDSAGFYGCQLQHGGDFLLDDVAVEVISTNYIDCVYALISNSLQLRIASIAPATADGVAFMQTDQLDDIRYSRFEFLDGHAIELVTPLDATQASVENVFDAGFGADGTNDAALYNNQAGAVVISRTGGTAPTVRNGTSASTTINATVNFELSNVVSGTTFNLDGIFTLATAGATWNDTGDSIIRMTASVPSSFATSGDVRLWNGTYYETYAYTGISGTDLTGVTPTLSQDFSAAKALLVMIAPKSITLDPHTENVEANQQFEAMLANGSGSPVYKPEFFEDNAAAGFSRRVAQIEDA
jgi:hypothetical protein